MFAKVGESCDYVVVLCSAEYLAQPLILPAEIEGGSLKRNEASMTATTAAVLATNGGAEPRGLPTSSLANDDAEPDGDTIKMFVGQVRQSAPSSSY